MRPLRVAFATPNLTQTGVFHWIRDLAANTEVQRITWCGGLITGSTAIDPSCAARLGRLMPLHCWYAASWSAAFNAAEYVTTHFQRENAYKALGNPDIVLAWEIDEDLEWFFQAGIPVVLVSHSDWWWPKKETAIKLAASAAVSEVAARPYRRNGLSPTVVHSGLSWDRCASAAGRENVRQFWRAGPSHHVTACLDRHDPDKMPGLLPYIMQTMRYEHLAVMYGADMTGEPATWLTEEAAGNDRVIFHAPIENVGDVYAGADLIFTGSTRESFAQVLFEGIAAGRPVLCRENIGGLSEIEALFGGPLTFKFSHETFPQEIGELIEHLRQSPPDTHAAQAFVRDYLSARRGAARWTTFLEGLQKEQIPVTAWLREQKYRWRSPNRPWRGILLCHTYDDLVRNLANRRDDVLWVAGVICDLASVQKRSQIHTIPVYTALGGPAWCHNNAGLRRAVGSLAVTADFVLSDVDELTELELLDGTQIPCIRQLQLLDAFPTVPPDGGPELRAVFLCTPIGYGGTERWAEQMFLHGAASGIRWVGCCAVDGVSQNRDMVRRFTELGVEVIDCGSDRQNAANAIGKWQPDIMIYTGLERIGQCVPAGYSGPVVAVAHNSGADYYSRVWAQSSDSFTSHSVAVSYLAVTTFPSERREDVVVSYPGIAICDFRDQRERVRDELGFAPDDVVVCFAGRADANKRPDLLVRAMATLPTNYKLLHVGNLSEWSGDEPYLDMARRLLPGRYRWLEFSNSLDRILAGADMLVLCSQHESFGLVLAQALQQGCQVIGPTRSVIGEFQHDPSWAHTPWIVFDGSDAAELGLRITEMRARPAATELPPVSRYFSADQAAKNFHRYLRETVKHPTGTGRKQLRQLRQSDIPLRPLPERTFVCDAVLRLGDIAAQNLLAVTELLNQSKAFVAVHACGDTRQLQQLRDELSDSRLRCHETRTQSWFAAAIECRQHLTSDFVLDGSAGVRSDPERAIRLGTELRDGGLELAVDSTDASFDVGRMCVRRQTLVDAWLSGNAYSSLADFQMDAANKGRSSRHAYFNGSRARHPTARIPFCDSSELPPRPGRATVSAVLPFRGHVAWAAAALDSLLTQQDADVTVHVVDDFSDSLEASEFLQRARRLPGVKTYKSVRNIGQFMAVNAVIAQNQANYWLIQDADDVSDPRRAWYTAHGLRESASDIFTASVLAFGGSMRVLSATYPYPGSWYFAINPVCGFTQGAFEQLGGYFDFKDLETNKASLDTDFFLRAFAGDYRFYVSGLPLLYYRQHIASCTSSDQIGIGSLKRTKLEQDITMRQVCDTLRYIQGNFRACQELVRPY
jgi:glycosyltransferase involved in cell wall biosynthesis